MMIVSYTDILLSDCALSFSSSLCYWIFFLMEIESVSQISTEMYIIPFCIRVTAMMHIIAYNPTNELV